MQLSYTLTYSDYKAAFRLHKRQKAGRRIYFFFYDIVIPATAVVLLAVTIAAYAHGDSDLVQGLEIPDGTVVIVAILVPVLRAYRLRKSFKNLFPPGQVDRTTSIDIDNERILTSVPGLGEGKYFWAGVSAFAQNEKATLIYITRERFVPFPTYAMSPAQRTELNDLVGRHVLKR
jgi:hypothetical protein